MPPRVDARSHGRVFDKIPEDYDRHRPGYPDALIDRACEAAALGPGDAVLEIGCGTGQLTRGLLARGLRVTAVEPGRHLIARAREQLAGLGEVEFVNARLEDAKLAPAGYSAVFSASAIHWVDPEVSWRKVGGALVDGGLLALLSYFGAEDPRSAEDQRAIRATLTAIAPELAGDWPVYRDLDGTLAGVALRRDNISEAWGWLGSYDVARSYAATLFDDAQVFALPLLREHTADQLIALLGTMSFWSRLSAEQREALSGEHRALHERLGRPIRSTVLACLLTARRLPRG